MKGCACVLTLLMSSSACLSAGLARPKSVLVDSETMLGRVLQKAPKAGASAAPVAVTGQPFSRGLRVTTGSGSGQFWDVQLVASTAAPIEKGDVLHVTAYARCIEPSDGDSAYVTVSLQKAGPPWTKLLTRTARVGKEWSRFSFSVQADRSYAARRAQLALGFGHGRQVVEIAALRCDNYARRVAMKDLPRTPTTYVGQHADAPWRQAAAARIEKHRKAELAVEVQDADGKAVPGATVHVKQRRHAFWFGTTVSVGLLYDDTPDTRIYKRTLRELFNHVSTENALKWPPWIGEWSFRREKTLEVLRWMKDCDFHVHGHVLVWPSWRNTPKHLRTLKNKPDALRKAVRDRIVDTVTATRGLTDEWDVVNEPYSNHDLMDVLGNDVMVEWFRLAAKTNPAVRYYINDYGILASGDRTDSPHQKHYTETIRSLKAGGAPLGGIGLQGHFSDPLTSPEKLLAILDRFAEFQLPLQVTEFDVDTDDEALQADYTRDFMTAVFSHPAVNGFCMWGFWEGRHWRPRAAMFRKDWSIKPNGKVYKDLVFRQWWTNETVASGAAGTCSVRGFHGAYEVTASKDGKVAKATVDLPPGGTSLKLRFGAAR